MNSKNFLKRSNATFNKWYTNDENTQDGMESDGSEDTLSVDSDLDIERVLEDIVNRLSALEEYLKQCKDPSTLNSTSKVQ